MSVRDLIPWGRQRSPGVRSGEVTDPFLSLHRDMNRMFDDILRSFEGRMAPVGLSGLGWPNTDVVDAGKEYRITAELPGMGEKDIELTFRDGVLTIKGERKLERDAEGALHAERYYGRFERTIALGPDVDEDKVSASFKNGELTIILPKMEAVEAKSRRIPISVR